MMKTIPLTHGKVAIVDGLDHEWLSQWKWYFHPTTHDPNKVYAARTVNFKENGVYRRYRIFIHRQLLGVPDKLKTDHINNDGLDNRRANIRPATQTQNARNIKKRPSRGGINLSQYINPSQYKGLEYVASRNRWIARILVDGRRIYPGTYATEQEAAQAYDEGARQYHGEFASLNFPHG